MSVGAPVVANDLSCISPLLVDDVNGMLATNRSTKALADALRRSLSDRATWTRLSEGARRTIETDWSWAGASRSTREAYDLALQTEFSVERQPPTRPVPLEPLVSPGLIEQSATPNIPICLDLPIPVLETTSI
jgi:hypothetical protein